MGTCSLGSLVKEPRDRTLIPQYRFNKTKQHTQTHVNRQTEKEGAGGRPRLIHTVLKIKRIKIFCDLSQKGYCVTISRRSKSKLLRESLEFT